MKLSNLTKLAVLSIACACAMVENASALTLAQFYAANPNAVGVIDDAVPFGDAERVTYVNNLLGLGANVNGQVIGTSTYYTGPTDYNGTVSQANSQNGQGVATVSGYQYLFVKYDGPNGGGVVYYLNGATFTIPGDLNGLVTGSKTWNGGISGWTLYNGSTPPPGVPDGGSALALLGVGIAGVGFLRRKLS